jgi:hypothetical protein
MTSAPAYHRLLRLRHIRPRPVATFVLFEGSLGVGLLLGLSETMNRWVVVALPATVALMVKFNDMVAGALARPQALAQLRSERLVPRVAVGRSAVMVPSRPTTWIARDDAVADPVARRIEPMPGTAARAVGVAAVPFPDSPHRPSPHHPSPRPPDQHL